MQKIQVAFEEKQRAKDLGAIFDRSADKRGWYIADDRDVSVFYEQLHKKETEEEPAKETVEVSTEIVKEHAPVSEEQHDWNVVLDLHDTLQTALAIKKWGVPDDESTRAKVLKSLGNRSHGQYVISYGSMCAYSDEFHYVYSENRLQTLASKVLRGEDIFKEIQDANITEEEKAFLMLAFPME